MPFNKSFETPVECFLPVCVTDVEVSYLNQANRLLGIGVPRPYNCYFRRNLAEEKRIETTGRAWDFRRDVK